MACNSPKSSGMSLVSWLERSLSPAPDLIVLGFQELLPQQRAVLAPLTLQSWWQNNIRRGSQNIKNLDDWLHLAETALKEIHGQGATYSPLFMSKMCAIGIIVFAKSGTKTSSLASATIGTGLMGVYPNKGAVALSITLHSPRSEKMRICLVSNHLGAHAGEKNCIWRNKESQHILDQLIFYPLDKDSGGELTKVDNHSICWFFGDLNYRLRGDSEKWSVEKHQGTKSSPGFPKRSEVLEWIRDLNISSLMGRDELANLRANFHSALGKFDEAPVTFVPTYKFDIKSVESPREYSTTRLPAYCDRILFRRKPAILDQVEVKVDCLYYVSVTCYNLSDHDPVIGLYRFDIVDDYLPASIQVIGVWKDRARFIYRVNAAKAIVLLLAVLFTVYIV